jgi:hypothetical protein
MALGYQGSCPVTRTRMKSNTLSVAASGTIQIMMAVTDAIYRAKQIASGILYAAVANAVSKSDFDKLVAMLVRMELVEELPGHQLKWIGGEPVAPLDPSRN